MRTFTQKLAFLFVALLCCAGLQVKAEDLTVADGTATSSYLPLYGLYLDEDNAHGQCIYPADLLSEMAGGQISQLTLYLSSPAEKAWLNTVTVSLGETSQTSLSSGFIITGLSAVYTGTLDPRGQTMEIVFSTPFVYSGENLVVDFLSPTAAADYSSATFLGTNEYSAASRYSYESSWGGASGGAANFLLKATFEYTPGGGQSCAKPSSLVASDVDVHSAVLTWAEGSGVYNLEYKKASDAEWTSSLSNTSLVSTVLSGLEASTAYQARVQSVCDEEQSGWRTVSFKTSYGVPYLEEFEASAIPADWDRYTAILENVIAGTDSLKSVSSGWSFGSRASVFGSMHAYINNYASSSVHKNDWLVSPTIQIESGAQLVFNLALTKYNNANPIVPGSQADHKFVVLITNDGGESWSELRTWDNAGSASVYDNISTVGEEVTIDLGGFSGAARIAFYVETTSSTGDNDLHIDDVNINFPPSCLKPTDLAIVSGSLSDQSVSLMWTENNSASAWKIQYKKAADNEWTTVDADENPFELSGLAGNTQYEVRVASACGAEDVSEYTKSISFTTLTGIPFEEKFNSSTLTGWSKYSALLDDVIAGSASLSSGGSWGVGSNNGVFDSHLYLNIYGTSCKSWIVTPAVLMKSNVQLTFDLALTKYSGTLTPITPTSQQDDRFVVLVSVDGGENWAILREWNNTGSADIYDNIATEGEAVTIDLSAFENQTIQVAFYGESTVSGGDNNLHIDNVLIDKIPSCFKPTDLKVSEIGKNSVLLSWTDNSENVGAWQLQYKKSSAEAWGEVVAVSSNPFTIEGLESYTKYDVRIAAVCDAEDEDGISRYSNPVSFTTAAGIPFAQAFNSSSVPSDWNRYKGLYSAIVEGDTTLVPVTAGWIGGSGNGVFPDSTNHLKLNIYGESVSHWIVSPSVVIEDNVQLSFDLALTKASGTLQPVEPGSQDDDRFLVLYSINAGEEWNVLMGWDNDGVFGTETFDNIPCSANGQTVNINLSEYAGESMMIAFYGESTVAGGDNYIHISRLSMDYIPECSNSPSLYVTEIGANSATFTWDEEEAAQWEYCCVANPAADFVPANEDFTGSTAEFQVVIDTLSENTAYVFYLRKNCGSAHSENKTIRFRTIQAPAALPFADDFEGGLKWLLENKPLSNMWHLGNATNNGGENSLYISVDGGQSNTYNVSSEAVSFATKSLEFSEDGIYQFEFDWKGKGEDGYDYLRVALAPAAAELVAGTKPEGLTSTALPSGWIALDGGSQLQGEATWQHVSSEISVAAGLYKVVLVWRNDGYGGTNPPAAVDNFSVAELMCPAPRSLHAVDGTITTNSIQIEWNAGNETNWLIQYKKSSDNAWGDTIAIDANPYTLENLEASTSYDVRIAAWCDPENEEAVSTFSQVLSVATECDVVSAFPYKENFDALSEGIPACWDNSEGTVTTETHKWNMYETGHAGKCVRFNSYSASNGLTNFLKTPEIAIAKTSILSFWYKNPTGGDFSVFYIVDGGSQTALPGAAGLTGASAWVQKEITLPEECVGHNVEIVFRATSNYGSGDAYIYLDDVMVEEEPECPKLNGVTITVEDITEEGATISWNALENVNIQYAIALSAAPEPAEDAYAAIDTNVVIASGLVDNADYTFYLRRDCGESLSPAISVSFHTLQAPVSVPFADDFEESNQWLFINGDMNNAWAYGTAEHNSGTHALYVSEDEGATYSYDAYYNAIVYAVKAFEFEGGNYVFQYDWKCEGYTSNYSGVPSDFLRVALVPASVELTASSYAPTGFSYSSLPTGWIALDGGMALSDESTWQTKTTDEIVVPAGLYNVVFIWRNSSSSYSSYYDPAAVDNFSVRKVLCSKPSSVAVSELKAHSAQISWVADEDQSAWQIAIDTLAGFNPDSISSLIDVTANPYTLTELAEEKTYYIYVRANCGDEQYSDWSSRATFRTVSECETPTGLKLENAGLSSAVISWNTFGLEVFNIRYGIDGSNWTTVDSINCPYTIENLLPSTAYQVQVQAACDTLWSNVFTFKTAYGVPYVQTFDTTTLPVDWHQYTGLLADVESGTAPTAATYGWSFGASNGVFNSHARVNVYGTSCNRWLATPAITLSENIQLTFDLALTAYNGTLQPVDPTAQLDDRFVVLASVDNGQNWTILREWNNAGSEFVFNNIACTADGEMVAINLSEYAGENVIIAFYAESTVAGGDNNLHIDNVLFDAIPACQKPTGISVSNIASRSAEINWISDAAAWQICINGDEEHLVAAAEKPFVLSNLVPDSAYSIKVRSVCDELFSEWSNIVRFTTLVACPAPDSLRAELTAGDGSVATLRWAAGASGEWLVQYSLNASLSDSIEVSVSDVAELELTNLVAESTYYARVKSICGGEDGESAWSEVISFVPTNSLTITINEGTSTNDYVPIYGLWADNYSNSQFVIPATDLAFIAGDTITSLTFYASNESISWGAAEFEVYMSEVSAPSISTLNPWDALTQVKNAASLSIVDHEMVVNLDAPFYYNGGHLLIGVHQTVSGSYKSCSWYGVSASDAAIGGYGTTVSVKNFLPMMTISFLLGEDPQTGIEQTGVREQAYKFIENGHVFILVNGTRYDATGHKVEEVK